LCLWDLERRELQKKFYNKTFGVENAIFTHDKSAILCSSKTDFRIMYWCLHNNEVIFSFLGHSDLILDINKNPLNDLILTTSKDNTSRLWELNKRDCICILQDSNCAVFDNTGKVIASVVSEMDKQSSKIINFINLYNSDSILDGPFKVFKVDSPEIKQIKFSNNGDYILASTSEMLLLIDSFEGETIWRFVGDMVETETELIIKADFSPDSKYVVSGSESGKLLIWNAEKPPKNQENFENNNTRKALVSLEAHPQTSNCVKFSPKHALLASSCTNLLLWIPDPSMNLDSKINKI